jgi:dipeptidyl aminopeptidase/acylaminoacyl peptidase
MAANDDVRPALDRSETNGFRCARETTAPSAGAYESIARPAVVDPSTVRPVDTATFNIFRQFYSYDPTPLEGRVESTQEFDEWRKERVSFAAAYGGERVLANVLLPKNALPPFQAVIFFPGAEAQFLTHSDGDVPFSYYFDFVPLSGRALVFPIYKGTYERPLTVHGDSDYRDMVVAWSKDLRRTVDYLISRGDMAKDKIAYYGFSMGSCEAVPAVALEPRLKAVIFVSGGLIAAPVPPEVAQANFLPRITVPVLLMNGGYDFVNPVETSQKPFFDLLGTPAANKKYVLSEHAGHVPPRLDVIRESLSWLEKYLGPVEHRTP